jgi:hypothetical protein
LSIRNPRNSENVPSGGNMLSFDSTGDAAVSYRLSRGV